MSPTGLAAPVSSGRTGRDDTTPWIDPDCALCGSRARSERFRDGRFTVVECRGCALVYVTPRLDERVLVERVYDADYWRSERPRERGYGDYLGDAALHRRTFERRLRVIARHLPGPGRLLEIGCAAGFFLELMLERGWAAEGVEPSEPMRAECARRLGGARVHAGWPQLAALDAVFLWDSLEHLPDPVGVLRAGASALRPGGVLVVETQNVESAFARLLGPRWQHFKHPEHLVHFSPRTLERALRAAGLRVVARSSRGAGKYVRAGFVVERAQRLGVVAALLAAPLAALGERALYVNPLDEMIVVAVKD